MISVNPRDNHFHREKRKNKKKKGGNDYEYF